MSKELSHIEVYFPLGEFEDKVDLSEKISEEVESAGSMDYCGYTDRDSLKESLVNHISDGDIEEYRSITDEEENKIREIISNTIEKCDSELPLPTKNYIFVYPYLPTEEDKVFRGNTGVASYSCVFHLFVNPDQYTKEALQDTVAHELNHTIYYYHHYDDFNNYTLLDNLLMEGLAENFKEQFFDSETTPWAGALDKDEAFKVIKDSEDLLDSKDNKAINSFLFGDENHERWTGYSAGYWLVKEYLKSYSDLSWDDIMKLEKEEFLEALQ